MQNLFAFGDQDGVLYEAKLQHALGVAASPDGKTLFVADTYNHKLKRVDIADNKVATLMVNNNLDSTDFADWAFKEPAGLCVSADGKKIYLADTNNHQVKVVTLGRNLTISKVQKLELRSVFALAPIKELSNFTCRAHGPTKPAGDSPTKPALSLPKPLMVSEKGGKILANLSISFADGLKLTEDAPQRWTTELPAPTFGCVPTNGAVTQSVDIVLSVPAHLAPEQLHSFLVSFSLITCNEDVCLPRSFTIRLPVGVTPTGADCLETQLRVLLDKNNVQIL